ncbi:hypothetical protein KQR54_26120 [Mycobacterium gordonae]|uniref:hypothetical protein n=1 Tax=Mycobacterium gordonae TaxID=1778 RepID=UPI00210EC218|nr:hypothetical protein [Mycobacterium gordonae]MCQ4364559.1 hypothetical protein [Mycobacterium gordonae]
MTELANAATPAENTGDGPLGRDPAPEATDNDVQPGNDENREAAKYRHRAKAAEAERDQLAAERDRLTERLTTLQRAEVERLAAAHLADGQDFWRDGAQLSDVLADDGSIDRAKVEATATALLESHKHWRKPAPSAPSASIVTGNDKIGTGNGARSFVDAFKPRSE